MLPIFFILRPQATALITAFLFGIVVWGFAIYGAVKLIGS